MAGAMKAISLHQPYASLVVHGKKTIETRSRPTIHRGKLAIQATKRWTVALWPSFSQRSECLGEPFRSALESIFGAPSLGHKNPFGLPLGAIVGTVDVVDCQEIEALTPCRFASDDSVRTIMRTNSRMVVRERVLSDDERAFGHYAAGRYAIVLENPVAFATPIPWVGRQAMFEVPDDIVAGAIP